MEATKEPPGGTGLPELAGVSGILFIHFHTRCLNMPTTFPGNLGMLWLSTDRYGQAPEEPLKISWFGNLSDSAS